MSRLKSLSRAVCLSLGLMAGAGAASAASFDLSGGSAVSLTDAPGIFGPSWFGDAASYASEFDLSTMWQGASLLLTQPASVTYTLVGFEAAFNNAFVSGQQRLDNRAGNGDWLLGTGFSFENAAAGALDFGFLVNGTGSLFANGSALTGLIFSNDRQSALVVFNDAYGDADFDDMVVRVSISPVPEPETLAMLLSGLGVVMVGARRRARREAARG